MPRGTDCDVLYPARQYSVCQSHIKKFFLFLLPLCHQTSETAVVQICSGGGSKVGGGKPHPQPLPEREGRRLRTVSALPGRDTPFSTLENSVFSARKRCFHCGEQFWCHLMSLRTVPPPPARSRSPPYRGGVGGGAGLVWPCCHLPPCCHHRYMPEPQRFRKAGGRVAAKTEKKLVLRQFRW